MIIMIIIIIQCGRYLAKCLPANPTTEQRSGARVWLPTRGRRDVRANEINYPVRVRFSKNDGVIGEFSEDEKGKK